MNCKNAALFWFTIGILFISLTVAGLNFAHSFHFQSEIELRVGDSKRCQPNGQVAGCKKTFFLGQPALCWSGKHTEDLRMSEEQEQGPTQWATIKAENAEVLAEGLARVALEVDENDTSPPIQQLRVRYF